LRSSIYLFLQICRERIFRREDELIAYRNEKAKAIEDAMYKGVPNKNKPTRPREVKPPTIESNFLLFFIKLMNIKSLLARFGYAQYWSEWNFLDLIDTAHIIMTREIET